MPGSVSPEQLASTQFFSSEGIITALVNNISRYGKPLILVFDDFHAIDSEEIILAVTFLSIHIPENAHLVITSRTSLPLKLASFRAKDFITEITAADLCFLEEEAISIFRTTMEIHIDSGNASMLTEKTEGWAAGLQLAALSIKGKKDFERIISGFGGTDRSVIDFFWKKFFPLS